MRIKCLLVIRKKPYLTSISQPNELIPRKHNGNLVFGSFRIYFEMDDKIKNFNKDIIASLFIQTTVTLSCYSQASSLLYGLSKCLCQHENQSKENCTVQNLRLFHIGFNWWQ